MSRVQARLRPAAREDVLSEVRYYRREAGVVVAQRLRDVIQAALEQLEQQPSIGSPNLGATLQVQGLRTWRLDGFPLSIWYFPRGDHLDVVRLVGHRQDSYAVQLLLESDP